VYIILKHQYENEYGVVYYVVGACSIVDLSWVIVKENDADNVGYDEKGLWKWFWENND